jgi:Fe-Mn family superoxide dismutase
MSISRRGFISASLSAMAGSIYADSGIPNAPLGVPLKQEALKFPFEALEPYMKASMLRRHYEEHHASLLQDLQSTLAMEEMTVGNVVSLMPGMNAVIQPQRTDSRMPLGRLASKGQSFQPPQTLSPASVKMIRHAGGGHINHTAFWRFMCPPGQGPKSPSGRASRAIQEDFGSERMFRQVFKETAMKRDGSGWAWLVYRPDGCLIATTTPEEDNPLMKDHVPWQNSGRPILALDLWEHSYYEQFKDDREQYIDAWWKLVNWKFVDWAYGIVTSKA